MTKFMLIAASLASIAAPVAASDITVHSPPVERVATADLNLHTAAGRNLLNARIDRAAEKLCVEAGAKPLAVRQLEENCLTGAIADARAQADRLVAAADPAIQFAAADIVLIRQ